MSNLKQEIPIFFSADDNYIPCLAVAIQSLKDNASKENNYKLIILNSKMTDEGKKQVKQFETDNIKINFADISKATSKMSKELELRCRDYYSETIYYRMFIPSQFPEYDKAIYLDSDIVIQEDIANLYNIDLGDNLLGAVMDSVVANDESFRKYAKVALGLESYKKYFNSGVLLMNLKEMRKANIEKKFIYLLLKYNLDTIAPDQDYLNILCKDRVKYLPETWDKMPDFGKRYEASELHLIHYNMFRKPWHYADVPYSDVFWKYAKKTPYYDELQKELASYSEEAKKEDSEGNVKLVGYSNMIMAQDVKFVDIIKETEDINSAEKYIADVLKS